jgi:glycosyltransferase involved in cell wall biosynthesis
MSGGSNVPAKILFFVTEDWYFCSHRLPLAVAAREAGHEVTVLTRVRQHGGVIKSHGLKLVPIELSRHGLNPLADLPLVARLVRIYREERPVLVHHVAMKPILYGSLAARMAGVPAVVNAFPGLGYLYASADPRARLARTLLESALRWLLKHPNTRTILQNSDDLERLAKNSVLEPARTVLIRGSGVDLSEYAPKSEPAGVPLVILASRMLWNKGVGEFVTAARDLCDRGIAARFALVGGTDSGNPRAVSIAQLNAWNKSEVVEWRGRQDDMPAVFADSHIVCLPTYYGEGVPKVLIEAAACGRPIVATDTGGCREIVRHGENGLLVPPRDPEALAEALGVLIRDPELRARMGKRGRQIAERDFSVEKVIKETLAVYRGLLPA